MKLADLTARARRIRLVLTDCDGVLTDGGVYYSERGEEMKRFSIRDGMGVVRLREFGIATGIVTGETSPSVRTRAAKLQIEELHLGIKDKPACLHSILARTGLAADEVAFIGDDTNDLDILSLVGLSACPGDATSFARAVVDFHCQTPGGHGCFRELAEFIIAAQQ
ncbi:3-deoxy-D-manno-octulosonate 8-phosphate phosphatase [Hymenobacter sedentarius]|uniref:3-deoxy-D-manno-octulosonate 8-phosphate phosphatase n=1 Tax=Hymenobacter sedentarius TaxID=1411621 RepID=A0A0U4CP82_9BACT|nr:HAD-IIIA family hydrolase [Hymenobacter sedentarius]ALW85182.1 3-deoxy-D-manno-octulosonate 8-phosphate phosphatase [Hymenobacter sedentarius]